MQHTLVKSQFFTFLLFLITINKINASAKNNFVQLPQGYYHIILKPDYKHDNLLSYNILTKKLETYQHKVGDHTKPKTKYVSFFLQKGSYANSYEVCIGNTKLHLIYDNNTPTILQQDEEQVDPRSFFSYIYPKKKHDTKNIDTFLYDKKNTYIAVIADLKGKPLHKNHLISPPLILYYIGENFPKKICFYKERKLPQGYYHIVHKNSKKADNLFTFDRKKKKIISYTHIVGDDNVPEGKDVSFKLELVRSKNTYRFCTEDSQYYFAYKNGNFFLDNNDTCSFKIKEQKNNNLSFLNPFFYYGRNVYSVVLSDEKGNNFACKKHQDSLDCMANTIVICYAGKIAPRFIGLDRVMQMVYNTPIHPRKNQHYYGLICESNMKADTMVAFHKESEKLHLWKQHSKIYVDNLEKPKDSNLSVDFQFEQYQENARSYIIRPHGSYQYILADNQSGQVVVEEADDKILQKNLFQIWPVTKIQQDFFSFKDSPFLPECKQARAIVLTNSEGIPMRIKGSTFFLLYYFSNKIVHNVNLRRALFLNKKNGLMVPKN